METDVLIIGAGMAGASLAVELAPHRRVVLAEMEDQPGRHSTGRSAAMFFESYGNASIRALTRASRPFLTAPPSGFYESRLLTPRAAMFVADQARVEKLDALMSAVWASPGNQRMTVDEALDQMPILDRAWLGGAVLDSSGFDIDVHALHHGYLRAAKRQGAVVLLGTRGSEISHDNGGWRLSGEGINVKARIVVNAAGAWADVFAQKCRVSALGLTPMRRTAITLPAPFDQDIRPWPLVMDVDEEFYFKPDAGQLLLSPANEDAMEPCDVVAEEFDVAVAVDRFERATTSRVSRISSRWAGLRTFAADRTPVVGFDGDEAGFFWFAGQGGYGIQIAPALACVAASLIMEKPIPRDFELAGVSATDLSPLRLSGRSNSRDITQV